jgi:polysaccharide export outer membrane protein
VVDPQAMHRTAVRRLLVMLGLTGCFLSACGGVSPQTPVTQPPGGAPGSTLAAGPDAKAPVSGVPSQQSAGNAALNNRLLRRSATAGAPADLPLGPGDLLEIVVFEVPELSNIKVRVSRPGTVVLPLLGEVPVSGKSPGELETDLRQRLSRSYMYDPHVTVFVHERRSQRVSVIGAVRKGGVFELSGRLRLADALAMAEGLADDADHIVYLFRQVPAGTVARVKGEAAPPPAPGGSATGETGDTEEVMTAINLDAMANGSEELNVTLESGDVIQVPRAGSIYVGGSVTRPGSLPLRGKTTVHQAILAAGGATNVAALADVRLYRTQASGHIEVIPMDLNEFEAGKGSPEVEKNDVVIVGKSAVKAFFFGVYDLFRGMFGVGIGL